MTNPSVVITLAPLAGLFACALILGVRVLLIAGADRLAQRRDRRRRIAVSDRSYRARLGVRTVRDELDGTSLDQAADFFHRGAAA